VIRALELDIDGVVTDGRDRVTLAGDAPARDVAFVDLDAIAEARRRGFKLALLTGEDGPLVRALATRLGIDTVRSGFKDKRKGIDEVAAALDCAPAELAFVGDANRDADAFDACGVSFAPSNATDRARERATFALHRAGGAGAIAEAVEILIKLGRLEA
jgi:3-deoxy-D-manno-octulosonate 8-phosphate phosphatase (KDO 8-P phosphatase)